MLAAEAHLLGRILQRHLDLVGARRGSATGEISRTKPSARMSGLLSSDTTISAGSSPARPSKAASAMAKTASLSSGRARLNDHLADIHHLAGLRRHAGDDAVEVGLQLGIGELILGQIQGGLGRFELGLGRAQVLEDGIVVGAGRRAAREQLTQTPSALAASTSTASAAATSASADVRLLR